MTGVQTAIDFLAPVAASLTGGLIGGKYTSDLAHSREEWALRENERLDSSKYQRTVKDLRAAGLNPMLAYDNGVGPSPTARAAGVPDFGRVGESAVTSGLQGIERGLGVKRLKSEIDLLDAQTASALANTFKTQEDTISAPHARAKMDADTAMQNILRKISEIGVPTKKAEADIESRPGYQWFKKITEGLEGILPSMLIPIRHRGNPGSPGRRGTATHVNRGF